MFEVFSLYSDCLEKLFCFVNKSVSVFSVNNRSVIFVEEYSRVRSRPRQVVLKPQAAGRSAWATPSIPSMGGGFFASRIQPMNGNNTSLISQYGVNGKSTRTQSHSRHGGLPRLVLGTAVAKAKIFATSVSSTIWVNRRSLTISIFRIDLLCKGSQRKFNRCRTLHQQ